MKARPTRLFVEPEKISKHLLCAICHEVFDNPNRLGCGHTFCYVCIEYWASMSKTCPLCKKSLRHRRPEKDLIAASLVDDMITQCSHEKCEWTDVYSLLKRHQRTCQHRERKIYESRNFDEIVELNDDSEIKETVQNNKKGNKKIKEEEKALMPTFPSSSPESQQIIRRRNLKGPPNLSLENGSLEEQGNYLAIPRLQPDDSFLSPVYSSASSVNSSCLDVRLDVLVPNRMNENQKDLALKNERSSLQSTKNRRKFIDTTNNRFEEEEKPQKNSEKDQQQKDNFNNDKKNEANPDEIQQTMRQSDMYEYYKDEYKLPSNYFIIEKNKRQEERQRIQKEQNARISSNKWSKTFLKLKKVEQKSQKKEKKKVTYSSKSNSQQDSSSGSNPFDQPIVSKRQSKRNGEKVMIVLDSSGESKLYESIQSGQMQLCYPTEQKTKIPALKSSKVQQKPKQSIEDQIINKTERINCQMNQLFTYQVEAQYQTRINRRNEMRGYSRN